MPAATQIAANPARPSGPVPTPGNTATAASTSPERPRKATQRRTRPERTAASAAATKAMPAAATSQAMPAGGDTAKPPTSLRTRSTAATATAAITAFYTWRMVALTFFGEERFDKDKVHPHESPFSMTLPLFILAGLALAGGVLGIPPVFHATHILEHWLEPITAPGNAILFGGHPPHLSHAVEWALLGLGTLIFFAFAHLGFRGLARIGLAGSNQGPQFDEQQAAKRPGLYGKLQDAWSIDSTYTSWIVQPLKLFAFVIAVVVDQFAVDGIVNGAAKVARQSAERLRKLSDGGVASYGLWMGAGAILLAALWMAGGAN